MALDQKKFLDQAGVSHLWSKITAELTKKENAGTAQDLINNLNNDAVTVESGEIISSISESKGVISVSKRALTANDIPTIEQSQVNGLETALSGKQNSLVFNTAYDKDSNKVATMSDISGAVAGLAGAMHFKGTETSLPTDLSSYESGDVIVIGNKEYVFDGSVFKELGDESIYAVAGSIKNADIAADAAIDQSKIAGLSDSLAGKVDVETGKSLVLDTEISKLANVSTGANKVEASTTNGNIKIDGVETTVYTEVANTVHDANYAHITVTNNSVSDGVATFNKYDDTALSARVKTLEDAETASAVYASIIALTNDEIDTAIASI